MSETTENKPELKINCVTWLKDTEDLFDFEASNTTEKKYIFSDFDKDYFIIKSKNDKDNKNKEKIDFINNNQIKQKILTDSSTKILGVIKYNKIKSNIKIINSYKSRKINNYNNLFKPEICERCYELFPIDEYMSINEGDIIKIGRIRIKFDKISFKSKNKSLYENIEQDPAKTNLLQESKELIDTSVNKMMVTSIINPNSERDAEIKSKYVCRLCYLSESTITDPLISPCNCSGSMKYIHLSCLKNSIKLKYHQKKSEYYEMFLFQNYHCEICLSTYPKYIIYKTKIYYLIDIDLARFDNYVICDLNQYIDNNNHISRFGMLIFKIEEGKEISLGRKKSNHIKLKDISISRNHCLITKKGNDLLMKDLGSKFGTMKYINDYYEINLKEKLVLVSGKHEMKFNLDKSWDIFSFSSMLNFMCCSCNQPVKEMSEIVMYNENDINELSNNELSDIKTHKLSYLSRFKDNDSYNDYIIKLDNIIGLNNAPIEQREEDENANEEEMINSQLKEKEESFTNS